MTCDNKSTNQRTKRDPFTGELVDNKYKTQHISKTQFDETTIAQKKVQFTILPQAANSTLRNNFLTQSTGTTSFEGGEMKISTGTGSNGFVRVETRERGEYIAGAEMEVGMGIRVPTPPTGSQKVEWGYFFNSTNGFGWLYDADGYATFTLRGGNKTVVRQEDWNEDKLDGTGDSRIDLDLATGSVFLIQFAWYGYGDNHWKIAKTYPEEQSRNRFPDVTMVHRERFFTDGPSLETVNLPVTVRVDNGGTAENLDVFVGGRQVSVFSGEQNPTRREHIGILEDYTLTAAENVWEPIVALQAADTFQGQDNPINIRFDALQAVSTDNARFRVTYDADLSGSTSWMRPDSYDENETAAEVAYTGDIVLGSSGDEGRLIPPFLFAEGSNPNKARTVAQGNLSFAVANGNIVIWAKRTTNNATDVSAIVGWNESF